MNIECFKCKKQTDELIARYPEKCDAVCYCGRVYATRPTWSQTYILTPAVTPIDLCEDCSMELYDLERDACRKVLDVFIQPERSKREDFECPDDSLCARHMQYPFCKKHRHPNDAVL